MGLIRMKSPTYLELLKRYDTIFEIVRWRAENEADKQAITYLVDGELEEAHLTYGELDCQARAIGGLLQSMNATGERALMIYPPGLDFITALFGCIYSGVVAVPTFPPDPTRLKRTLPRLRAVVQDAQPTVLLTTSDILLMREAIAQHAPETKHIKWLASDQIIKDFGDK